MATVDKGSFNSHEVSYTMQYVESVLIFLLVTIISIGGLLFYANNVEKIKTNVVKFIFYIACCLVCFFAPVLLIGHIFHVLGLEPTKRVSHRIITLILFILWMAPIWLIIYKKRGSSG